MQHQTNVNLFELSAQNINRTYHSGTMKQIQQSGELKHFFPYSVNIKTFILTNK